MDKNEAVGIGVKQTTHRGFELVKFTDAYEYESSLQCSSAVVPHVWLGVDDVRPRIMAKDAAAAGIATPEVNGWVPFPIPEEVVMHTRMHLNREQVKGLVSRLQNWLDSESF